MNISSYLLYPSILTYRITLYATTLQRPKNEKTIAHSMISAVMALWVLRRSGYPTCSIDHILPLEKFSISNQNARESCRYGPQLVRIKIQQKQRKPMNT